MSPEQPERAVVLTRRTAVVAAAGAVLLGWAWLWRMDLAGPLLVGIAAVLIVMPLLVQQAEVAGGRTVVVTKRGLVLSMAGLVTFGFVYDDAGVWFFWLAAVCVVLPLLLATSCWWGRRRRLDGGWLRHPLRPERRPHLAQAVNVWLCCGLLGGVVAAGGTHYARIGFSLNVLGSAVVAASFAAGLVLLAALALMPRSRVDLAPNLVVVLLSGFLATHLLSLSVPPTDQVVLDSPLTGEWFVQNGGRSALLNGHAQNESNAVDFQRMGANERTHTGGGDAPLAAYAGYGSPVLAPAGGRVVEVTDSHPDNPPGTNSDEANHLVIDIGGGRYVSMAHLQYGSVTVVVGDDVRRGDPLAAVGNNGHSSAPHLHLQVQDSAAPSNAGRTFPMVFRGVEITRGGPWPWGGPALRTGDLVSPSRP